MKVIIAGSREVINKKYVFKRIDSLDLNITEIVSGGCRGVDTLAEMYAKEKEIPFTKFEADWNKHGLKAGPIRNREMAEYVGQNGCLVLIWNGKSKGSGNMLSNAKSIRMTIKEFIV